MDSKEIIAKRIAKELKDGDVINLGIGIPNLVPKYTEKEVFFQSDNGALGLNGFDENNKYYQNAGGQHVALTDYGCFFDSVMAFDMIGGGHIDVTVLGALQVDEQGNLANWMIPGKLIPGMGGAMDLVAGAKKVIIAMEHTSKGNIKIVKKCTLPLTAKACVDLIVTDLCVIEVTDSGLMLTELCEGVTVEDVLNNTEANLTVSPHLKHFS